MTIPRLLADAMAQVRRAPLLVAGLWLVTAAASLPLALVVWNDVATELGSSARGATVAAGGDYDWVQEFGFGATGVSTALTPRVVGFAAVLDNASGFVDRQPRPLLVTVAAVGYLLAMVFLTGGVLDRLARRRPLRAHGFFGACGGLCPRLIRLGLLSAIAYALLAGPYHAWLFDTIIDRATRDVTAERSVFMAQLLGYVAWLVPLGAVNLLFDYAKVRAVVEDRRSAFGALAAAARFLRSDWRRAVLLYVSTLLMLGMVIALYAVVAPGVGGAGAGMWAGFVLSQLYIAARLTMKLLFWSAEITFFQSRLAHAGYVRRAAPAWPESPTAESL